MYNVNFSK